MGKNDNIFIKLQIEKDNQSGDLTLGIYFDINAPNFSTEKDIFNWSPTLEEIDFIVETYEMISEKIGKNYKNNYKKQDIEPSFRSPKKMEESPIIKNESRIDEVEPLKVENNTGENPAMPNLEQDEGKEKIFVQAEEEIINKALSRNKGEPSEEFMVEADEKTIIDKVLKQKLKNKK